MAARKKKTAPELQANRRHRLEPEPFSAALGGRIRDFRHEQDISFDAVVGLSDLGRGYVSEVERGLAVPSVLTLCKLADALNMSAIDLLNEICPDRPNRPQLINISRSLTPENLEKLVALAQELLDSQPVDEEVP